MSTGAQKFIVVFKNGVNSDKISDYIQKVEVAGGALNQRWDQSGGIVNGFSATIPESALTQLQSLVGSEIDYIEPDGVVTTQ